MSGGFSRRALLFGRAPPTDPTPIAVVVEVALCLAHRGVDCQCCRDACPESAIRFPPRRGTAVPQVDAARCTGCGECLGSCPAAALALPQRTT